MARPIPTYRRVEYRHRDPEPRRDGLEGAESSRTDKPLAAEHGSPGPAGDSKEALIARPAPRPDFG
ncbi:unnamed protein product [Protopolystoma xenopodis]|uniref:Uncharacterized protein n=1 Tax=Protopolystoma xenopodis TaxID=117903 RepID=A0A448WZN7_9PLAT|nr:unnamed protein product [Protopolystoma xenopodis]